MAKKAVKAEACSVEGACPCKAILAVLIIVLLWVFPGEKWSKITITVAAALIFIGASGCACNKTKKK